jgi:hypothetical protein
MSRVICSTTFTVTVMDLVHMCVCVLVCVRVCEVHEHQRS